MADDLHSFRILRRQDLQLGVLLDEVGGIDLAAIDLAGDGGLGQPRADRFGHLHDGHRAVELAFAAVGEGNRDHRETTVVRANRGRSAPCARSRVNHGAEAKNSNGADRGRAVSGPRRRAWWAVLGSNQ